MNNDNNVLTSLIASLSKAEKKNFKILSQRVNKTSDKLYVKLFDFIVKAKNYTDEGLLNKHKEIKKEQIPNLRSKLYSEILYSLRHLQRNNNVEIQIRESLDYASILFNRGFYKASILQIKKAKKAAAETENDLLLYSAISLERRVETQFITGNSPSRTRQINILSSKALKALQSTNDFSNFSLALHGLYLKNGFIKNKTEFDNLKQFFENNIPSVNEEKLGFYDKIFLYQAYVWYNNMIQDFASYYKYSKRWTDLFDSNSIFIETDLNLYLNGLYNCLNALYMADKREKFRELFSNYKNLKPKLSQNFDKNSLSTYEQIYFVHFLNDIHLNAEYNSGVNELNELVDILHSNPYNWDHNKMLIFNYKIACVYFGAGNYTIALDYLNKIINEPIVSLRLDIHCFARILSLISHFELGNERLVSYQIKSVYRFLSKLQDIQGVHKEIFIFLRKTSNITKDNLKTEFQLLKNKLVDFRNDPFEKRPFLYLDIIGWLDSKIQNRDIQDIIQERIGRN